MNDYEARFGGISRLYGKGAQGRLQNAHVCVIGIGGVGTWVVEALARSGVGHLTLVDMDDVCITNTNRQLPAMEGNVGRPKVTVMADRVARINPACQVHSICDFFTAQTADQVLATDFDYIVDAIDHPKQKALLIAMCQSRSLPIVTVGGAGGRWDPSQVQTDDLVHAFNDGLLRRVRKTLRKEHNFPKDDARWGIPAVFSKERAIFPTPDGGLCRTGSGSTSLRLDCASGFGTASFVTGTYGFAAAAIVVKHIADPPEPVQELSG
jgi:tRNA A37 threonylcarbamoyladenosine dehydratase